MVALLGKGGACGTKVAWLAAVEAELLFNASFMFFWGEFGDFDGINGHGVGVVGFGIGGVGE